MGDRDETYDAIRRMLARLDDPFTRFLEPARYAALKRGNAGSLTGVGVEVGYAPDGKSLVVRSPLLLLTALFCAIPSALHTAHVHLFGVKETVFWYLLH